jgi:hypothetical protein
MRFAHLFLFQCRISDERIDAVTIEVDCAYCNTLSDDSSFYCIVLQIGTKSGSLGNSQIG